MDALVVREIEVLERHLGESPRRRLGDRGLARRDREDAAMVVRIRVQVHERGPAAAPIAPIRPRSLPSETFTTASSTVAPYGRPIAPDRRGRRVQVRP